MRTFFHIFCIIFISHESTFLAKIVSLRFHLLIHPLVQKFRPLISINTSSTLSNPSLNPPGGCQKKTIFFTDRLYVYLLVGAKLPTNLWNRTSCPLPSPVISFLIAGAKITPCRKGVRGCTRKMEKSTVSRSSQINDESSSSFPSTSSEDEFYMECTSNYHPLQPGGASCDREQLHNFWIFCNKYMARKLEEKFNLRPEEYTKCLCVGIISVSVVWFIDALWHSYALVCANIVNTWAGVTQQTVHGSGWSRGY